MLKRLVLPLLYAWAFAAQAGTNCRSDEEVVFSCPTRNGKIASLCLGTSGLSYRFGGKPAMELDLRDPGPSGPNGFRLYHYFRAGVDRSSLQIDTPDASYEVFTNHERPYAASAGVSVVLRGGERRSIRACTRPPIAQWYRLEAKVACSDEAMNSCTPPPSSR